MHARSQERHYAELFLVTERSVCEALDPVRVEYQ